MHVGPDPVGQFLGRDRLGVEVVRRPQHGHEQLRLERHRVGPPVVDRQALTREVDEELLPGPVLLAHHQVQMPLPAPVVMTELAVGIAVLRVTLLVLQPQQHERHPAPLAFLVDMAPVRQWACRMLVE